MSQLLDAIQGVVNAAEPLPGLVTGGQPSLAQLQAFKRAGGQAVLDIRDPMEPQPFRTPDDVTAAGLEYARIPVSAATRTDATLAAVRAAGQGAGGKKVQRTSVATPGPASNTSPERNDTSACVSGRSFQ